MGEQNRNQSSFSIFIRRDHMRNRSYRLSKALVRGQVTCTAVHDDQVEPLGKDQALRPPIVTAQVHSM
jgi:hypothetical protein